MRLQSHLIPKYKACKWANIQSACESIAIPPQGLQPQRYALDDPQCTAMLAEKTEQICRNPFVPELRLAILVHVPLWAPIDTVLVAKDWRVLCDDPKYQEHP